MKIYLLLGLLLLLLTSCEKEDNGLKYYRFQKVDEQWFTHYKKCDTITFVSSNAPTRKYVVWGGHEYRKAEWHEGFYSSPKFYYDYRDLEIYRLDHPWPSKSSGRYDIHMSRFPQTFLSGDLNSSSNDSRFMVSGNFDDYNGIDTAATLIFHDSRQPAHYQSLTLNGQVYNEVVLNQSNNPNSYCRNCPNDNPQENWALRVNRVYYHKQYGVIRFSDLDGVTWQIKK